jgi:hypothetical protein
MSKHQLFVYVCDYCGRKSEPTIDDIAPNWRRRGDRDLCPMHTKVTLTQLMRKALSRL